MSDIYIEFITVAVVFLYLFFGVLMFSYKKGNRLSKTFLGLFFISIGLVVLDVYLQRTFFYEKKWNFYFILNLIPLLLGPILLILTKSVTQLNYKFSKKDFLHFGPYFFLTMSSIFSFHIHDQGYKKKFVQQAMSNYNNSVLISSMLIFIILFVYLGLSYRRLRNFRLALKKQLSDLNRVNLEWLEYIFISFLSIIFFTLLIQVLHHNFGTHYKIVNVCLAILLVGMLFFILVTIIKGVKSEDIFSTSFQGKLIEGNRLIKEKNVDLQLLEKLKRNMTENRPFLNPSLSLKELSNQIDMNPRALSNLINQGMQQSFFDFINSYRIDFAKNEIRFSKDKKQTISEVMYASGFNSKSSFNTAFKKHTSVTPSQWKKSIS